MKQNQLQFYLKKTTNIYWTAHLIWLTYNEKHAFIDDFPNVFGDGAEKDFIFFYNQLENNNFSTEQRVKSFYYFQIGRWDLATFE